MTDFLPVDSSPYWTGPRPSIVDDVAEGPPKADDGGETHRQHQHINESLAKLLHTLHLNYYHDTKQKDVKPRVDVIESKVAFTAYVELPGMTPDEVHVEANDHLFHIGFSGVLQRRLDDKAADKIVVSHKDAPEETAHEPSPGVLQGAVKTKGDSTSELRWCIGERKTGHFHRVLQLPVGFVDMAAINVTMANGLMVITVPKRETGLSDKAKPGRKIDVGLDGSRTKRPNLEAL